MRNRFVAAVILATVITPSGVTDARADWRLTTLAEFDGTNGAIPKGLTRDSDGSLYGTTESGGVSNLGTVWRIAGGSNALTTLGHFKYDGNGTYPAGGVAIDADGNLFGTTGSGGTYSKGTVWEIARGSGQIKTLAAFNGANGSDPAAGVTIDADGNLYGTASLGGVNESGTVWKFDKGSGSITPLAFFDRSQTGADPLGRVTIDADGNLLGTSYDGRYGTVGAIWKVDRKSNGFSVLDSFTSIERGAFPYGDVALAADGSLFGTTAGGGASNHGTIWTIPRGSNSLITLASFDGTNGDAPTSLAIDADGNLFGTATLGGSSNLGTVWELARGSNTITTLVSFNGIDGRRPTSLLLGADGNLYGTTLNGGRSGDFGTIFQLSPVAAVPEPSAWALLAVGGAALGLARYRNRTKMI